MYAVIRKSPFRCTFYAVPHKKIAAISLDLFEHIPESMLDELFIDVSLAVVPGVTQ